MQRISIHLFLVMFAAARAIAVDLPAPWTTTHVAGADVLKLTGTAEERGRKQGEANREQIKLLVEKWLQPTLGYIPFVIKGFAKAKVRNMTPHIPAEMKTETDAMSAAVGIDPQMGLIANSVPDILELARKPFACSTLAVLPERSDTGGMLYARNLDYSSSEILREHWRPVVFATPGKHKILGIELPGFVGLLTAINDQGVTIARMTAYNKDITSHGDPTTYVFREILEQAGSAEEAAALYAEKQKRTVSINVMITDPKTAVVLEVSATKHAMRRPNDGRVLYSANHYVSPEMSGRRGPDARWKWLSRYDATKEKVGVAQLLETMCEAGGVPNEKRGQNVLSVVFDYAHQTLFYTGDGSVRGRAACAKGYRALRWDEAFAN